MGNTGLCIQQLQQPRVGDRLRTSEAHGEECEAIAVHLEATVGLAILGVDVGGLLKIEDTLCDQGVDVSKHVVVALLEVLRDVAARGEHAVAFGVDDGAYGTKPGCTGGTKDSR